MINGETITVITASSNTTDEMGEPVKEWTSLEVGNVLVRPLSGDDESDEVRPDGVRAEYSLAFPKTAAEIIPRLKGARIALTARGMSTDPEAALIVSGVPDITTPCPTPWNCLVSVGRVYG